MSDIFYIKADNGTLVPAQFLEYNGLRIFDPNTEIAQNISIYADPAGTQLLTGYNDAGWLIVPADFSISRAASLAELLQSQAEASVENDIRFLTEVPSGVPAEAFQTAANYAVGQELQSFAQLFKSGGIEDLQAHFQAVDNNNPPPRVSNFQDAANFYYGLALQQMGFAWLTAEIGAGLYKLLWQGDVNTYFGNLSHFGTLPQNYYAIDAGFGFGQTISDGFSGTTSDFSFQSDGSAIQTATNASSAREEPWSSMTVQWSSGSQVQLVEIQYLDGTSVSYSGNDLNENSVYAAKADGEGGLLIDSNVGGAKIALGGGNDTLISAGLGSVINAGQGQDTFNATNDVLIVGAKPTDKIEIGTHVLHGGLRYAGSESPYAVGLDGIRYGVDSAGELVIKDFVGDQMYVANYQGGPNSPTDTAGIYIANEDMKGYLLLDPNLPSNWEQSQFEFVNALYKAYYGVQFYQGVDPLVVDLTGAGINLTDTSSVAPVFDINGNGFAVHTGWVEPNVGFLVIDKNGDGNIENVGELIGGEGQSGFAALAAYDSNGDGIIDANDPVYSQLMVWADANGNGIVDPGELMTLAQAGIASINLMATAQTGDFVAGNQVLATGSYARSDGTTGTVANVSFHTDNFNSTYVGDSSVTPDVAALPDIKGFGTLTDLQVAMSHDPNNALLGIVASALPSLDVLDLASLRTAMIPILTAWAAAVEEINPDGTFASVQPTGHADLPILVATGESGTSITDFAYQVTDSQGTYWKLASGKSVLDANGNAIALPSFQDIMNQQPTSGSWTVFSGAELDFLDRYSGDVLPIGNVPQDPGNALASLSSVINLFWSSLNEIAVALAMQGPLAQYFPGIAYDATNNTFKPTTVDQLAPMYEAIFQAAPQDPAGATAWLNEWKPILDVVLQDFARGQGLEVTYAYRFANVVAAYEAVGLPVDIVSAASALGVPGNEIVAGAGDALTGSSRNDIFYLSNGDQTATDGAGTQNYVLGGHFGNVTIDQDEPAGDLQDQTTLRFATIKSTDVTAYRDGIDLVLKVNGTDQSVTLKNEFTGVKPGFNSPNLNDTWGASQITFADGVVWDTPDIAWAVAPNTNGVNGSLIGTFAMDVLDGGRGNHFLSGGDGGDVYLYDKGDGADTIDVNSTWILLDNPNYVVFGPGLSPSDITFSRSGDSQDLLVTVNDSPGDSLLIQNQFQETFTGVLGNHYFNQIQIFKFADGTEYSWQDVQNMLIAQEAAVPGGAIYGYDSDDYIDPGQGGGHYISGGNGSDTYVFRLGYGNDTIYANRTNLESGEPTVLFNPDADPSAVTVIRHGNSNDVSLVLADGSTLTIQDQFDGTETGVLGIQWINQVATFQFQDANNTVWTANDLRLKGIASQEADLDGGHAVYGFPTDDVLDPGIGGNDFLSGGDGNDTYVFGHGYGHDQIQANHQSILVSDDDTLLFTPDVDPSQVTLERAGSSYDLNIFLDDGSELDVLGQFDPSSYIGYWFNRIQTFQFQDAAHTTWSWSDIDQKLLAQESTTGSDTIYGFWGADTIDGRGGNDYVVGGGGNDTYIFNRGYGQLTIDNSHFWTEGIEGTLQLGPGIAPSDVQLARSGANANDLILSLGGGDEVTIVQNYAYTWNSLGTVSFADGTVWTYQQMLAQLDIGAPTNTSLYGDGGSNILDGKGYATYEEGRGGDDTYVFGTGYGQITVNNDHGILEPLEGTILLNVGVNSSDVTVSAGGSGGNDLILSLPTGDTLTVLDHFGEWYDSVKQVEFADGTTWNDVQLEIMAGKGGSSIFPFDMGNGHITLTPDTSVNTIAMGDDVAPSDVIMQTNGMDLLFTLLDTGDTLDVQSDLGSGVSTKITQVSFGDGTLWQLSNGITFTWYGTAATTTLPGSNYGSNVFHLGSSGDQVTFGNASVGGSGQNTVYFDKGDGAATVNLNGGTGSAIMASDIAASDAVLQTGGATGTDLVIKLLDTGESLDIANDLWTSYSGTPGSTLQSVSFADGTVWNLNQPITFTWYGTAGYTSLVGGNYGSNVFHLGSGDDAVTFGNTSGGGSGQNTVYYDKGDGAATINLNAGTGSVVMASDIAAADVALQTGGASGADLILKLLDTGETLDVQNNFWTFFNLSVRSNLQTISFADGTVWNLGQSLTLTWYGTASTTTLTGSNYGSNLFDLGQGGDAVTFGNASLGASGQNTVDFDKGDGGATVNLNGGTGSVALASDIAESDVVLQTAGATGADLVIKLLDTGEMVDVQNNFWNNASVRSNLQTISFADGTVWNLGQPLTFTWYGTTANTTLAGSNYGSNIFHLGAGGDTVTFGNASQGANGQNTVYFDKGDGAATVNLNGGTGSVVMASDISASDVGIVATGNTDLVLKILDTGETLDIKQDLSSAWNFGSSKIGSISFADGTVWTTQQFMSHVIENQVIGTTGNNNLYGTAGPDIFDGKGGSDYEQGNGGPDTFLYNPGYGSLQILEDAGSGVSSTASLVLGFTAAQASITADPWYNMFITDGTTGDKIQLEYMMKGTEWAAANIEFSDGTLLTRSQAVALADTGSPTNTSLYGTTGADTFDSRGYAHFEQGQGGGDTFLYNSGYGSLEISEDAGGLNSSTAVLALGAGITASQVSFTADPWFNLYMTDGTTGDKIQLDSMMKTSTWNLPEWGVAKIQFADGTALTRSQIVALADTGSPTNTKLYGTPLADTFDSRGYATYEQGQGGADTFVYNPGYGNLEISEDASGTYSSTAVLSLGAGITASQVSFTADGSYNMYIIDGTTGDQVKLDSMMNLSWWGLPEWGVAKIQFADGTSLTRAQAVALADTGSSTNTRLCGTPGADTFDSRGYATYEQGQGGADTFIYNPGYENLEISEDAGWQTNTTANLQLGTGLTPGQISITTDSSGNIYLADGTAGDQVKIDAMRNFGYGNSTEYGVANVKFADGTVWTRAQVDWAASVGTSGADTISGTTGNDIIDGRGGTDTVTGGGGSDTYIFRQNYGQLSIDNSTASGSAASGQLDFGLGIDEQQLWFLQSGNDLTIDRLGISDQVTVKGWFSSNPSAQLSEIKLTDGMMVDSGLNQLVAAMAAYQSNNPGFDTAVATEMPLDQNLQNAIVAAWHR